VTLRSTLKSLRHPFVFPTLRGVLRELRSRAEQFRVAHFSVQETHIHLVVEAASARALSSGLRSLTIRIAKRVNRLLMRRGQIFADRWHARPLISPRAVRHVLVSHD
jgi:REP element-mobilizing transposase RayT